MVFRLASAAGEQYVVLNEMNNEATGKELKKLARARGNFVKVNIPNFYNTLDTLSYFFYRKKHEWIAICFIDNEFLCRLIWFNKGTNHQAANIELSVEEAIEVARKNDINYIVLSHNHPVSSYGLPDYGSRRLNIQASYDLKAGLLGFSDQDKISGAYWQNVLNETGIRYADAVFVAGTYKISGDSQLIENYNQNKPSSGCYISTAIFGGHSYETNFLRGLRDNVLMKNGIGIIFCKIYYFLSPRLSKYVRKYQLLNLIFKLLILYFIYISSNVLNYSTASQSRRREGARGR